MKIKVNHICFCLLKKISSLYIKNISYVEVFTYRGKSFKLYENHYNCGKVSQRMTDRSLELAMARNWIDNHRNNIIELGAVTPYYFKGEILEIVDPSDSHRAVTIKDSLFNVNLSQKNVLCISTVEHVGLNDYGYEESKSSIQAIRFIVKNSKHCLITYPIGYNNELDNWTKKNFYNPFFRNKRIIIYKRNLLDNKWKLCKSHFEIPNSYGPLWANAIAVIEK